MSLPNPEDKRNYDVIDWKAKYENLYEEFEPLKKVVETMKIQIQELQKLQIGLSKDHPESFETNESLNENQDAEIVIKEEQIGFECKV